MIQPSSLAPAAATEDPTPEERRRREHDEAEERRRREHDEAEEQRRRPPA